MRRKILFFAIGLLCSQQFFAQTASEVLERGEPIQKGHRLFLKYDLADKTLKVDAAQKEQDTDFTTLEDSLIFLVRKNAVNFYVKPLNPLNFSYNTETKIIIDPINEAAAKALGSITEVLGTITPTKKPPGVTAEDGGKPEKEELVAEKCGEFKDIQINIEGIQEKLTKSQKDNVLKVFESLKKISFADEKSTIEALNVEKENIRLIDAHFIEIESLIEIVQKQVKNYPCNYPEPFTAKYIFNAILKDLSVIKEEQEKRLKNLQTAYKLVKDMQEKASIGGGSDGLRWCIPLNEVPSKEGKISIYKVTIKESGYGLSENKEIVSTETKEITTRHIRLRRFQRFIPEVSVGTAFTFLKYYSYGTTSDETGQQYVGTPTENTIKNLNITTMINFNYFIPNSPIHPLYQLGVGINSEMPTILTGFGLRSNINGINRFAISGGIAMTWIKELDKLKVGDKINGTDDIDKDFKFGSSPKFSPYISLQYNF